YFSKNIWSSRKKVVIFASAFRAAHKRRFGCDRNKQDCKGPEAALKDKRRLVRSGFRVRRLDRGPIYVL
ncbi:hypothetical protein, partial [Saccharicrinis sp. GN24d3]|uniref:hypothetical protein n=1 Tax=Saccharicrinis sp. GN24d3 TaxID=3458416 RepID=UPI0040358ACE